jgi:ABC-type Mn2+/Zn2+ transport system permease subunit
MTAWITDPLAYTFFSRALLAALIVGVVCPVLGSYIVLRGMTFIGDAIPHIILPGIVIAWIIGWPVVVGALIVGVAAALGIGALSRQSVLREDTAIGVILAGAFALGIALLSVTDGYAVDLTHFLFGNLLGVGRGDLQIMAALALLVLLFVFLFYKELLVVAFDPVLARTLRLPATFLDYLLLVLIAITIVVALQAVGVTLMLAMLVTPAATAALLTRRLITMMGVGVLVGTFSGLSGLYLSWYVDVASGPAIVLVATALFALVYAGQRLRARWAWEE